jgi:hypothetical protein
MYWWNATFKAAVALINIQMHLQMETNPVSIKITVLLKNPLLQMIMYNKWWLHDTDLRAMKCDCKSNMPLHGVLLLTPMFDL